MDGRRYGVAGPKIFRVVFLFLRSVMAQHYTRTADRARLAQAAAEFLMPAAPGTKNSPAYHEVTGFPEPAFTWSDRCSKSSKSKLKVPARFSIA